ncbi:MAG: hypothetical protein M3Q23_06635 [Actinomycetota bacterium]|nr:hypothetical protein [Actinomycetota bacterium]
MSDDLNEVGGHCPRCGTEYRPGFTECADCHVPLVAGPAPPQGPPTRPARDDPPPLVGDLAILGSWPWQEAWLMAGRLRTDGIDARVEPDNYASAYGTLLRQTFDVIVPKEELPEAQRIAARYQDA